MTATLTPPCADDPELFFSEQPGDVARAKQTCMGCWRMSACLDDIAADPPSCGVWAGINFSQPAVEETVSRDCVICGQTKPLVDFRRNAAKAEGRESRCASCATEQDAARTRPARKRSETSLRREADLNARAVRAVQLRQSGLSDTHIGLLLGLHRQNVPRAIQRAYSRGLVQMEAAS